MKRNRRRKKHNVILVSSKFIGLGGLVLLVMGGLYIADSQCNMIANQLKELQTETEQLERELARERVRWADRCTPEALKDSMKKHLIDMNFARADQIVRVERDGMGWKARFHPQTRTVLKNGLRVLDSVRSRK